MKLTQTKFLFIDCQTTGMRPPAGRLLELAWGYGSLEAPFEIKSSLVVLPEGHELPRRVSEITGIRAEDMQIAKPAGEVFREFEATRADADAPLTALIHYAQFEKPFLADLYAGSELPFEVVCTHQLCKRALPQLPSNNIRGAAGFFGVNSDGFKRAAQHVSATIEIWRGLAAELARLGIDDLPSLRTWLADKPSRPSRVPYAYRIDRLKRLELPDQPGIYRMFAKSGKILYVGKATSLRERVNSYFRGRKGRDQRKLEMMAQVWDLKVTRCETPLEAALLESDEIKLHNPPYNVVMKRGRRHLVFYNDEFTEASMTQDAVHIIGPFRDSNWIEHLRLIIASLGREQFDPAIFYNPIPGENISKGFEVFRHRHGLTEIRGVRTLLAKGMWLLKNHVEQEDEAPADSASPEAEERELTSEEIADKFERLLRRSAAEYRRAKSLTRLLNARIRLKTKRGEFELKIEGGQVNAPSPPPKADLPWRQLAIDDFDRMSVLLSELGKVEHTIC